MNAPGRRYRPGAPTPPNQNPGGTRRLKIPANILDTLKERAEFDGPRLVLTGPRFERKVYQRVNEVLEAVGGRWTSDVGAHVFPVDAAQAIAPVLTTGAVVTLREKRQQAQYFPTPQPVVDRLVGLADLESGMRVLEPSAGSGAIAQAAAATGAVVDCIEQDPGYAAALADSGCARTLTVSDFLSVPPQPVYDRVLMNPPFTRGTDVAHVEHALRFLKPDGLLVSVMSWAVTEQTRKTAKFRALVEGRRSTVEAVPDGAFRESGTNVPTVLVAVPATRAMDAQPTVWPIREVPEVEEMTFRDPKEILDELRTNLHDAMAEFDALAELLATPVAASEPAAVIELPRQEQLSFEVGEAS